MTADLHCDTISRLWTHRGTEESLRSNSFHLDLRRMKEENYIFQCFAIYLDTGITPDYSRAYREMYQIFKTETEKNSDLISQVFSYRQMEQNKEDGKVSALLTLEEGCVADTPERLRELYNDGVRLITLTWNHRNLIGCPNCICPQEGLTKYGLSLLEQMEEYGMAIDVSHLSDRGFYDVYENTKKPFLASHSNARELTNHCRNLTADMIKKIAERGGIIGLNFETSFLLNGGNCGTDAIVRHLEYMRQKGGIESIALGSDFDGIEGNPEIRTVSDMYRIDRALGKIGWNESMKEKLFWKNTFRYFKEILE